MDSKKIYAGLGILVVGLVIFIIARPAPEAVNVEGIKSDIRSEVNAAIAKLGSIPGTTFTESCLSIGGRPNCLAGMSARTATGTICAIKNPIGATSTAEVTLGTNNVSSTTYFTVGTTTQAGAAGGSAFHAHPFMKGSIATGTSVYLVSSSATTTNNYGNGIGFTGSSSPSNGYALQNRIIVGSNEWLSVVMQDATGPVGMSATSSYCGFGFVR